MHTVESVIVSVSRRGLRGRESQSHVSLGRDESTPLCKISFIFSLSETLLTECSFGNRFLIFQRISQLLYFILLVHDQLLVHFSKLLRLIKAGEKLRIVRSETLVLIIHFIVFIL